MKPVIRNMATALAAAAGLSSAQAGVLAYQDVVFATTWASNVLTLEIDAAQHSGDWSRAASIGALGIKDIGSFQSVTVTAAPKGVELWKMSARELTANGCGGGSGRNREKTSLCLSGTPVALSDNMVFSFAFSGTPNLDQPHLKVNFLDASNNKVGDLLSKTIAPAPVVVTQPATTTPPSTAPVSGATAGKETFPVENSVAGSPVPLPSVGTQPVPVLEPVSQTGEAGEVPEPHAIALLLGGLALMGLALRKRS